MPVRNSSGPQGTFQFLKITSFFLCVKREWKGFMMLKFLHGTTSKKNLYFEECEFIINCLTTLNLASLCPLTGSQ